MPLTQQAPAKINLYLDILFRRADGFHELETIFHRIALADELSVEVAGQPRAVDHPVVDFTIDGEGYCRPESIPTDDRNLVVQAFKKLETATGKSLPPLSIHLRKRIPHGAGLGGGSSDAAAALFIGNELLDDKLTIGELIRLAGEIGSDCAFFLMPEGAAIGTGRGERLSSIPGIRMPALLVLPEFSISTKTAYQTLTPDHLGRQSDQHAFVKWLKGEGSIPYLYNGFSKPLEVLYPELRSIRENILSFGRARALLSGSGSATFGLFGSLRERDVAAAQLAKEYTVIPTELIP